MKAQALDISAQFAKVVKEIVSLEDENGIDMIIDKTLNDFGTLEKNDDTISFFKNTIIEIAEERRQELG